jgi:hypothetical protein
MEACKAAKIPDPGFIRRVWPNTLHAVVLPNNRLAGRFNAARDKGTQQTTDQKN